MQITLRSVNNDYRILNKKRNGTSRKIRIKKKLEFLSKILCDVRISEQNSLLKPKLRRGSYLVLIEITRAR